jgi:hypothetical protein
MRSVRTLRSMMNRYHTSPAINQLKFMIKTFHVSNNIVRPISSRIGVGRRLRVATNDRANPE